jgi:hypothetical protein
MGRTLAIVALLAASALALAGCGIEQGRVTKRHHTPGYDHHYTARVPDGRDCGMHLNYEGDLKYSCKTRYRSEPRTRWIPDEYFVTIEACEDKKCKSRKVEVSQDVYDKIEIGESYDVKTRKIIPRR